MDKATLAVIKEKANRGTSLQDRIQELKNLRERLNFCETVIISYEKLIGGGSDYISKNTNDVLLEPVKESLTDIIDNQIKMYEIEFSEL